MISRERLQRLGSAGATFATTRRARIASRLLLLGGLIFVLLRLQTIWHDSRLDLAHVDWPLLVGAAVLSACGVVATAFVWVGILRRLGVDTESWFTGIFLQAQLGKYIPGSLWQYAGRTTLARAYGLPLGPVTLSLLIELVASALTGVAGSLLLFGVWGAAGSTVVLVGLSLVAYPPIERRGTRALRRLAVRRDVRGVIPAAAAAVRSDACILVLIGFGFWLTGRALFDVPAGDVLTYVGAFIAAWLGGLIAIYAPGGIGVREALLVALLRGKLGAADALVLAAASRAILTLVDILAAGAGVVITRRGSPLLSAAAAVVSDVKSRSSA